MPSHPESLTHPSQAKTSASTTTQAPWDPIYLHPEHIQMIKEFVHGIPYSKIVYNFKRYGVKYSNRHIRRICESPKGREYASFYSAQVHGGTMGLTDFAKSHAPEALYRELDVMRNPLAGTRHQLSAAQDILDRTGPVKISRQEVESRTPTQIFVTLSASQLSQFASAPATVEATVVHLLENPSSDNDDVVS